MFKQTCYVIIICWTLNISNEQIPIPNTKLTEFNSTSSFPNGMDGGIPNGQGRGGFPNISMEELIEGLKCLGVPVSGGLPGGPGGSGGPVPGGSGGPVPGGSGGPVPGGSGSPVPGGSGGPVPGGQVPQGNNTLFSNNTEGNPFIIGRSPNNSSLPTSSLLITPTTTIKDICIQCNISLVGCNCENKKFLCGFLNKTKNEKPVVKSTLECRKTANAVEAIFNTVTGVIGFFGNALVVVVTIKFYSKRSRCHCLIAGLAVNDAIFSIIQCIFSFPMLWRCDWSYGLAMCKFLQSFGNLSAVLALGIILIIAIERYFGILYPLSGGLNITTLYILIIGNIICGVAITLPNLIFLEINEINVCQEKWPTTNSALIYTWVLFIVYTLIPVLVIAYLYYHIIRTVYSKEITQAINEQQREKRFKDNRRIVMILVSVLVAFVVLVFPNRIVWLIHDHNTGRFSNSTIDILTLVGFIPYSIHVAINPIIYSFIDDKFRQSVSTLFFPRGISKKKKTEYSKHTTSTHGSVSDVVLKSYKTTNNYYKN